MESRERIFIIVVSDQGLRETRMHRRAKKISPRNLRQFYHEGVTGAFSRKLTFGGDMRKEGARSTSIVNHGTQNERTVKKAEKN